MRARLCLFLLLPLAAHSEPADSLAKAKIAVFDFKSGWHVDYHVQITDAGASMATGLRHDLAFLPPLEVVDAGAVRQVQAQQKIDLGDVITPVEAKQLGNSLGATTLVTGQMYLSGAGTIVAAKVVSVETGQALGTMVKGDPSMPFADLVSRLSVQIGKIALVQRSIEPVSWGPATIVGTRRSALNVSADNSPAEIACVLAIDGEKIPKASENWSQVRPLLPGFHDVVITGDGDHPGTGIELVFDAKPGATYQVAYDPRAAEGLKMWIIDLSTLQRIAILNAPGAFPRRRGNNFFPVGNVWGDLGNPASNNTSDMGSSGRH